MSFVNAWYTKAWWLKFLLPVAWIFQVLAALRRARLQAVRKSLPVPVIVIGNITVGGTGKTPAAIALVRGLQAAGCRPGIISRGFGARPPVFPYRVSLEDSSAVVGDEPLVLLRNVDCPVVLDPRRRRAAKWIAGNTDCDVIVSDDGLQHYWLSRDVEILMIDGERGLGNGYCLPAGPLREPPSRIQSVDHVVINGEDRHGLSMQIPSGKLSHMRMEPLHWVNVQSGARRSLEEMRDRSVYAIAGIGNPDRFFGLLQSLGYDDVRMRAFPDHHRYSLADLTVTDGRTLVMTEKDAVKCRNLASADSWYLAVQSVLDDRLVEQVVAAVAGRKNREVD